MSSATLLDVRETAARRFDPRVRILWMLGISIAVMAVHTLMPFLWLGLLIAVVWYATGVLAEMLRFTVRALPFALFLFLLWIITGVFQTYGFGAIMRPMSSLPTFAMAYEAIVRCSRFLVMVTSAKFLFLTTDFAELSGAIRSFQRPWLGKRGNSLIEIFAFVLGFSFQSVPLMVAELGAVIEAERGRGVDVNSGGKIAMVRNYVRMTPICFLRCLTIGQFTVMALLNFRFNPFTPRSMYREFAFGWHDRVATIVIVLILIALIASRFLLTAV